MPSSKAKLGLLDLLGLLKRCRDLLGIDTSEEGLRDWLRKLVTLGEFLTDLTGVDWDDDALAVLSAAIESDEVYARIYAVIRRFLESAPAPEPVDPDGPLPILDSEVAAITAACSEPATIPVPWATLISLLVQIISWITRE